MNDKLLLLLLLLLYMSVAEKKRLNVMAMRCLRSMCGVTCMDRVKSDEVRRRTGVTRELASRVEKSLPTTDVKLIGR